MKTNSEIKTDVGIPISLLGMTQNILRPKIIKKNFLMTCGTFKKINIKPFYRLRKTRNKMYSSIQPLGNRKR